MYIYMSTDTWQAKQQANKRTAVLSRGPIAGQGSDGLERPCAADIARLKANPSSRSSSSSARRSSIRPPYHHVERRVVLRRLRMMTTGMRGFRRTPHVAQTLNARSTRRPCPHPAPRRRPPRARPRSRSLALATIAILNSATPPEPADSRDGHEACRSP